MWCENKKYFLIFVIFETILIVLLTSCDSELSKIKSRFNENPYLSRYQDEGANVYRYDGSLKIILNKIIIHHSTSRSRAGFLSSLFFQTTKLGYSDIAYHYFIEFDGTIYEGRNLNVMGAHQGKD